MKKAFALAMAGLLTLSSATVAFAEEEIKSVDYTMINQDAYQGTWYTAIDLFNLYLPNDWETVFNVHPDEGEEPDGDIYFVAQNDDGSRSVTICYGEADLEDYDSVIETLEEEGVSDTGIVEINGITAVGYRIEQDDVEINGFVTLTDDGGMYNVMFAAAIDDQEFAAVGKNLLCSFSLIGTIEIEAETETEA